MHDVGNPGRGTPSSLDSVDGTRHCALGRDRAARPRTQRAPATAPGATAASVFAGGHAALTRPTSSARAPPPPRTPDLRRPFHPLGRRIPSLGKGPKRAEQFFPNLWLSKAAMCRDPTPSPWTEPGHDVTHAATSVRSRRARFRRTAQRRAAAGSSPMSRQNASRIGCASRFPTPRADDAGTIRITVVTTDRRLP